MDEVDLLLGQPRRVGAETEILDPAVGVDHAEGDRPDRLRGQPLPGLAQAPRLLAGRHHRGKAGDDLGGIELRRRVRDRVEHVRRGHDEEAHPLARLFGQGHHAAEEELLVAREDRALGEALVAGIGPLGHPHRHHDQVPLSRVGELEGLLQMLQGVVVADEADGVAGADPHRLGGDGLLSLQSELVGLHVGRRPAPPHVDLLGGEEKAKEDEGEAQAADGGDLLGDEVHGSEQEEYERDGAQAERQLRGAEGDVERHLPLPRTPVLEAQHEHRQRLEGEGPDDAEGIGLAERVGFAPRSHDGHDLEQDDEVDEAVGRAVLPVGLAEPGRHDAVLAHPVEDPVGADDRRVDGPGQHQEPHHDDEALE